MRASRRARRRRMSNDAACSVCSALIAVLLFAGSAVAQPNFPTAIPQTKFNSGQDIVPYFEGWIRNKDGSFAITLIIGIAASMVSAIFVVKTLFLIWLQRRPAMTTLSV